MKTDQQIFNQAVVFGQPVSDEVLDSITSRYPWFDMPVVMKLGEAIVTGKQDRASEIYSRLDVAFLSNNYYNLLRGINYVSYLDGMSEIRKKSSVADEHTLENEKLALIDAFLTKDLSKRVPETEDRKQENVNLAEIDEDNLVSEDIARVYVKLGQISEAKKIYNKLCLKYPEKSVYFAEIISALSRNGENGQSGGMGR